MTKKELAKEWSEKLNLSIKKTGALIEDLMDFIYTTTIQDGRCLCGKHKFKLHKVSARSGRNPNTGEKITIPAKEFVVYRKRV